MSSLRRSRSWILGGFGFEFSDERTLSAGALSDLADGFLRQTLPILLNSHGNSSLLNLKGRNAQDALLPGIGHPAHDELFRLGGTIPVQHDRPELAFEPFEVSLLSPFSRFEGSHGIVHELEQHRAGPIPSWLPLRLMGYVAPVRPSFLRIGLERFRSLIGFASLGYAPQVTDSLLIDCVDGKFALRLVTERNKTRDVNPFAEIPAFRAIAEVVRSALGYDLSSDLAAALRLDT